jgi:hypothetical protein
MSRRTCELLGALLLAIGGSLVSYGLYIWVQPLGWISMGFTVVLSGMVALPGKHDVRDANYVSKETQTRLH